MTRHFNMRVLLCKQESNNAYPTAKDRRRILPVLIKLTIFLKPVSLLRFYKIFVYMDAGINLYQKLAAT